jgi:molybdenum cofactor synthesis domain-containing protein
VIQVGETLLELTQIGKVCHTQCAIYQTAGDCIMPRAGLFARVIRGGEIAPGAKVEVIETVSRSLFQAAVLTVSDRCSRGETNDTAGPATANLIEQELPARLAWTGIVPDEQDQITTTLKDLAERGLNLILTVGGTGCAPRDVTPEATRALIQKEIPGLAEAMRRESAKITPNALTQRGVCGIYLSTLIVNLPGSEKAAVENLRVILPALPHAMKHLRGEKLH